MYILTNPHFQFFVFLPAAVIFGELLITGWRDSSLRLLLRKGRSVGGDWFYWALHLLRVNDVFVAWATVGAFAFVAGRGYSLNVFSGLQPLAQFAIGFVVVDFCAYWTHRALHDVPLLWDFHKVHHSGTDLNVLMTFRFHPMEKLVWHAEAMAVFLFLGSGVITYAAFTLVDNVLGQIQHARVRWSFGPVGKWIISPTFHRLHHSMDPADYNRNLGGRLAVWDRAFGTYSARDIPFNAVGTGEELQPVWREFLNAFKRLVQVLPLMRRASRPFGIKK